MAAPAATAWVFVPWSGGPFGVKNDLCLLSVLALAWLLKDLPSIRLPSGPMAAALGLISASSLLSWTAAVDPSAAFWAGLRNVAFLSLFVGALNVGDAGAASRAFGRGLVVAGTGVALFGLKQVLLPDVLDPGFKALGKMRVYSTLGNPNLVAVFLLASLPATAVILRSSSSQKLLLSAAFAAQAACLIATRCRDAVLAAAVMGFAALLWFSGRERARVLLAGAALLAAGVVSSLLLGGHLAALHSMKGRAFIWMTSLWMLAEHPLLGVGPGNYGLHHMEYQARMFSGGAHRSFADNAGVLLDAHNDFLELGATTGVVGMAGLLGACALVLWKGSRAGPVREIVPGSFLGLVGVMTAMLFNGTLFYGPAALNFWLMAGLVWKASGEPLAEGRPAPWARRAGVSALALLAALHVFRSGRRLRAGLLEGRGDVLMEQRDSWMGLKSYAKAAALAPKDGRILLKYATACYLEKRYGESLRALESARRISGDVGVLTLQAEILARMERWEEAAAIYREIIAAYPGHVSPRFILGQIYLKRGEKEKALEEFRAVMALNPSSHNLNMTRGKVARQKELVAAYLATVR